MKPGQGRLEELGLAGNMVGDRGAAALARVLSGGRCMLRRLDLSRCGLGPRSAMPLAAMLQVQLLAQRMAVTSVPFPAWDSGRRVGHSIAC